MADWVFEIRDATNSVDEKISSNLNDVLGSGASEIPAQKNNSKKKTFTETFNKKASNKLIGQIAISPLNTITGGLASPVYSMIKQINRSATMGAVMGTLGANVAVIGIQAGINYLENRVAQIEEKVKNLNNTDNALIRAGTVSTATYYTGNIFGIKSKTNRS